MSHRTSVIVLLVCVVLTTTPAFAQTTIFSDGFEGAFPGSWSVGNNNSNTVAKWGDNRAKANSGNWSAFCADNGNDYRTTYDNGLNTYMQRINVSLAGYSSATLTFRYWKNTELSYDGCEVNVRDQYGTWRNEWSNYSSNPSGWRTITIDMDRYAGQPGLIISFDFVSDDSVVPSGDAGVWIDDVSLTAVRDRIYEVLPNAYPPN
ncbi:MAG: hypothetical protein KAV87_14205 [Desulfobacteraceae bacterium]|nr:hypothetical protein [Desulfobacteraceae bacterium]